MKSKQSISVRCIVTKIVSLVILALLLVNRASAEDDQECGNAPLTVSTDKEAATKLALDGLAKRVLSGEVNASLGGRVTTVITQFPNADQTALRLGAWIITCKTIKTSTLSATEKVKAYLSAVKDLLPPAPGGLSVLNAPLIESSRKINLLSSSSGGEEGTVKPKPEKPAVLGITVKPIAPEEGADGWALRYLPAYRQNEMHQFFVIVKSVTNADEGVAAITKLRQQHPNYDFALFDHYQGSPYMGIMMAAWVTKTDAEHVLQVAKAEVAADSYIWTF